MSEFAKICEKCSHRRVCKFASKMKEFEISLNEFISSQISIEPFGINLICRSAMGGGGLFDMGGTK